jgi:hypothetical protein
MHCNSFAGRDFMLRFWASTSFTGCWEHKRKNANRLKKKNGEGKNTVAT